MQEGALTSFTVISSILQLHACLHNSWHYIKYLTPTDNITVLLLHLNLATTSNFIGKL